MNKVLETYNLPKLNREDSEALNRKIITAEVVKLRQKKPPNLPINKSPDWMASQGNFTKHSKKNKHLSFLNYSKKFNKRKISQAHL